MDHDVLYKISTTQVHTLHGHRWCADSWDTVEQSELPPMRSLAKAMEPSGLMVQHAVAQNYPWTYVPSMDGASTTVFMKKMQEWCAKVVPGDACIYE